MIETPEPTVLTTGAEGFALGVMLTAPDDARLDIIELTDLVEEVAWDFGGTAAGEGKDCGRF